MEQILYLVLSSNNGARVNVQPAVKIASEPRAEVLTVTSNRVQESLRKRHAPLSLLEALLDMSEICHSTAFKKALVVQESERLARVLLAQIN